MVSKTTKKVDEVFDIPVSEEEQVSKVVYLDKITRIIERMTDKSTMIKIIANIIIIILLAFRQTVTAGLVFAAVAFAVFDAYYLYLERGFRALYDKIDETSEEDLTGYDMKWPDTYVRGISNLLAAMKSPSVWGYYGILLVLVILCSAE